MLMHIMWTYNYSKVYFACQRLLFTLVSVERWCSYDWAWVLVKTVDYTPYQRDGKVYFHQLCRNLEEASFSHCVRTGDVEEMPYHPACICESCGSNFLSLELFHELLRSSVNLLLGWWIFGESFAHAMNTVSAWVVWLLLQGMSGILRCEQGWEI